MAQGEEQDEELREHERGLYPERAVRRGTFRHAGRGAGRRLIGDARTFGVPCGGRILSGLRILSRLRILAALGVWSVLRILPGLRVLP